MKKYKALQTKKTESGYATTVVEISPKKLPVSYIRIAVEFSSINYKDGLSAAGNPGVTKNYPHTPGIDAAGKIIETNDIHFDINDKVIVTGFDLGMNTDGGLSQEICIPAEWAVKLPQDLSCKQAMIFGTAGLTAKLCLNKIESVGIPTNARMIVSGAAGGVGSLAVCLAAIAGYKVTASSGKAMHDKDLFSWLTQLGANEIIDREKLSSINKRPILKSQWQAAIDVAGGNTLANILKQIHPDGSVACCGLAESSALPTTVLPFILRGVNLLGVDSVEISKKEKQIVWEQIAQLKELIPWDNIYKSINLTEAIEALDNIIVGKNQGRIIVDVNQ